MLPDSDRGAIPSEELVGIVIRAGRLGFSATRVATALGISADGVAAIQRRIAESAHGHDGDSRRLDDMQHAPRPMARVDMPQR